MRYNTKKARTGSRQCGPAHKPTGVAYMRRLIVSNGDVFGRWTVVREAEKVGPWRNFECECECGTLRTVAMNNLRRGLSRSCGCLRDEVRPTIHSTHGATRGGKLTPEYVAWRNARSRCYRPTDGNRHSYAERGITVCERWLHSFEAFLADMGMKPTPGHSIDRIDNDGPYSPENCRWATRKEQARNKQANVWIAYNGEKRLMVDVVEQLGVSYNSFRRRYYHG